MSFKQYFPKIDIVKKFGLRAKISTTELKVRFFKFFFVTFGLILVSLVCTAAKSSLGLYSQILASSFIIGSYIYILNFLRENIEIEENKYWQIPLFYIFVLMMLALAFVPMVYMAKESFIIGGITSEFDAFYFNIITLSSVGYGELHPINMAGKIISISMAVLGSLHMIVFLSLLLDKLPRKSE